MSSVAGQILDNIRDTLAAAGVLKAVLVAPVPNSDCCPRAEVTLAGLDEQPADDSPAGRFVALRAKVSVFVRDDSPAAALERALDLAAACGAALLVDRFRGGLCRDLPTGKATQLGPSRVEAGIKTGHLAVAFEVRCHFQA